MLKHLGEHSMYVEIAGFRDVAVKDSEELLKAVRRNLPAHVEIQLFDADLVATWQHLYFSALNALTAFRSGRGVSKSLAVETVLYASTERQIKKAIQCLGVKPSSRNVAAVILTGNAGLAEAGLEVVAKCLGKEPDDAVLELTEEKVKRVRAVFAISDAELQTVLEKSSADAVVDLVLERVALLSTHL
ncbi:MAG: KEOPS complex subunit Cgi121 [Candidatus Bathyarchaeia archaeon]